MTTLFPRRSLESNFEFPVTDTLKLGTFLLNFVCIFILKLLDKSLKKDDLEGKSSVAEWKVYSKKRIQDARSVANLVELKPDTNAYAEYVDHVVSYYKPKQSIQDFPKVKTQSIKVPMSEEQNTKYQAAQKKVNSSDMDLLKRGVEVTRKTASFNAFLNATRQISNTYGGKTNTPKLKKVLESGLSQMK